MALDFYTLIQLKKKHPAWRLLSADSVPLILSFLDRVFKEENNRTLTESQLRMQLDDFLYQLNQDGGDYPRDPRLYLDDWASDDKGWLRKFYPPGSDEPHFDLTPSSEKAIQWVESLLERGFVGTESRLFTALQLLREIVHGTEEDQETRIARLIAQKQTIDQQIQDIKKGILPTLDDRELKERFIQFSKTARELLADFRSVEQNLRDLDVSVREKIASWSGEKGEFLQTFFLDHDTIRDSDQGRSFQAFWDFLMSPASQEELTDLLDQIYQMENIVETAQDRRIRRIHYDWISAGEQTQRTVSRLSQQLRRFLDDKAYLENKRIVEILSSIESHALDIRQVLPQGNFMDLDRWQVGLSMPMERPLFRPPEPVSLDSELTNQSLINIDPSSLYEQIALDKQLLWENIVTILGETDQISLDSIVLRYPLKEGLAELIAYLSLATENPHGIIDESNTMEISWIDKRGISRTASLPKVLFHRSSAGDQFTLKGTTEI